MKVRKAVIPAAGLGTRVLPASKAIPKEMLPIVDKPAIQFLIEEAVAAGITDILIIIGRGKQAIEDHFDRAPELEQRLQSPEKKALLDSVTLPAELSNILFVRQKEAKGLGHAIYCAKSFAAGEPFAVLYGDDVIIGEKSATAELCEAFETYGKGVAGIKPVLKSEISKYSSLKVSPIKDNLFNITDMIEKPAPGSEMSLYSILGRCVLTPEIFDVLSDLPPGAGGEIQLTDAMKILTLKEGMIGVEYGGKRYDMGNKSGMLEAIVDVALTHDEVKDRFLKYLKSLGI